MLCETLRHGFPHRPRSNRDAQRVTVHWYDWKRCLAACDPPGDRARPAAVSPPPQPTRHADCRSPFKRARCFDACTGASMSRPYLTGATAEARSTQSGGWNPPLLIARPPGAHPGRAGRSGRVSRKQEWSGPKPAETAVILTNCVLNDAGHPLPTAWEEPRRRRPACSAPPAPRAPPASCSVCGCTSQRTRPTSVCDSRS